MSYVKVEAALDDNCKRFNRDDPRDLIFYNLGQAIRFLSKVIQGDLQRIEQRLDQIESRLR